MPVRRCGSPEQRRGVPAPISPFDTSACHLSSYLRDGCAAEPVSTCLSTDLGCVLGFGPVKGGLDTL